MASPRRTISSLPMPVSMSRIFTLFCVDQAKAASSAATKPGVLSLKVAPSSALRPAPTKPHPSASAKQAAALKSSPFLFGTQTARAVSCW